MKVVLSADGQKTALKSWDPSGKDGQHFEIMLWGNHLHEVTSHNVIFSDHTHSVVSYDPYPDAGASDGTPEPITVAAVAGGVERHA